jgi:putative ABC transport system permease protein
LLAIPKGFNPNGVLTLTLRPGLARYPLESPQRSAYFQESLARVQSLPGIQSAGLTSFLPLTAPTLRLGIDIEGRPPSEPGKQPIVDLNFTSPEYFQTIGIELRAGRLFTSQDGPAAAKVVIINETLARRLFPDESPIGHSLLMWMTPRIIVGVAGDTRHLGLDQEVRPEVYIPYLQGPSNIMTLVVKAASGQKNPPNLSNLASVMRGQVSAIEPNEPVYQVVPLDQYLSNSLAWRRFQMLLLSIFAAVAFVIATIGIYGVISYAVSQRTHEIGIRMALGAKAGDVLRMVVWHGMRLALIGVALGVAAALALTRVMQNLLFNVSATDPATFALIVMLLIGVALVASYIPARRAMKIDPLTALRIE